MLRLRDLMRQNFVLLEKDTTIQEGVSKLMEENKNIVIYMDLGEYYYVDKEAFLLAIKKGMDVRLGKLSKLGIKASLLESDTPLYKIVERIDSGSGPKSDILLVTRAQTILGTIAATELKRDQILRAKIANDIYKKLDEEKLAEEILENEKKIDEESKKVWDQFANDLRSLVKVGEIGTPKPGKEKKPKIALLYNSIHILHKYSQQSPENPERLLKVMSLLEGRANVFNEGVDLITKFSPVSENELALAHDENYIEFIKGYCEKGGGFLGDSTYLNFNTLMAASFAAGAAIKASNMVLKNEYDIAWALMRPPGHHASANKYGGFCLFNTAAITARYLQQRKGLRKIMILDWDGHAANGTQSIFYGDGSVLLISLHQDPKVGYPHSGFTQEIGIDDGRGYNVNVVMPPKATDEQYSDALKNIVAPVADSFKPDFVIGCNGFDAHFADDHTNLKMTSKGYHEIGKFIKDNYLKKSIIITEGGYHKHNSLLVVAVLDALRGRERSIKETKGLPNFRNTEIKKIEDAYMKNRNELIKNLKEFHPELK